MRHDQRGRFVYVYRPYTAHSALIGLRYVPWNSQRSFVAWRLFMNTVRTIRTLLTIGIVFVAFMTTSRPAAAQGDPKKGEQVYAAQKCQICHSIAGKGGKANPLDGVGGKLSAADIKQWITNPKEMATTAKSEKKPPMPDRYSKLPAEDVDALVAYVQTLK